jgi:hypothetical protein
VEAGAGPLLDRRGAGASVAFRGSLLSLAGGSIFVRGDAGARTGRCADAPGACTRTAIRRRTSGHFEDQRETNIELVRGLPADTGSRKAKHRAAGEITLSQMLHEWALHDLGHVRQIAELVRARKYLAGAGPLGQDYHLRP